MVITETLQNIKAKLAQGSLQLNKESLGSETLANQVQQALSGEVLELNLEQNTITETRDSLHFQATAASLLGVYYQPVEVVFFIHNHQLECLIKSSLPDYWDFSWNYPDLPDYTNYAATSEGNISSFFYDLHFAQPLQILFSSYNYQEDKTPKDKLDLLDASFDVSKVYQGLNYFSVIDFKKLEFLNEITKFINHNETESTDIKKTGSALIEGKPLPLHGHLDQQAGDEQIKLIVDLPFNWSYQNIFSIAISSLIFYSSTSLYSINARSGMIFIGGLTIGDTQHPPHNVALIWPIGSTSLIIKNAEPIPFPGFETFTNLLEGHLPTDNNNFPISTSHLNTRTLEIREIVLHLSLVPPNLSYISLSVGTAEQWSYPLLGKALAIKELLLKWEIAFGSKKNIQFEALGAFEIGGGLVYVSGTFPDFVFNGELALYQTIELSHIFQHFLPNAELPQVSILDLALSADIKQGNYALELDIASDWEIKLGRTSLLPLKYLRINLEKDNSGTFATIDSVLNLAGVDIILLATNANESSASGWTFVGSTRRGQEILIGTLMEDLAHTFEITKEFPKALEGLIIENLRTSFNTATKNFTFTCECIFEIESEFVDIILTIDLTHQSDGSFKKDFQGYITIETLQFDIHFIQNQSAPAQSSNIFVATYSHSGTAQKLKIKDLVKYVSSDPDLLNLLDGIEIDLKDALFAYSKTGEESSKFLFGLDISANINLSNLPLIGKEFPPDQTVSVDDLQLLVTSKDLTQEEVNAFNKLIPQGLTQLRIQSPEKDATPTDNNKTPAISQGVNVTAQLKFGSTTKILTLPVAARTDPSATPTALPTSERTSTPTTLTTSDTTTFSPSDNAKWFTLQKTFGPVHFERVGIQYKDAAIWFLLDTALSAAGLTLSLDGLSVGSPLSKFDPKFNLKGIGIDYKGSSAVEIGGAFLRKLVETPDSQTYEEYNGYAVIKTKKLALSAIGSYTKINGHPSLFIYATLDGLLGGPPFFFVTGLAAGFGYNRTLKLPPIEQVAQFPLIQAAISAEPQPSDATQLTQKLETLKQYIPPETGEIFLAVGIKFTSFKMIDSFALLTIAFGSRFELNLLGISTLIAPTPETGKTVTPLAEVQLALKATFIPNDGILQVRAQLTPASYIFSRNCHLTGGFAFYSWFGKDHPGDFILTLGGYHPNYKVPGHYPQVPRLGFNWQVNDYLSLKGDAYCALTPGALMAGFHLQATWESSNIKAWFNAGADFLIAWKPYHYQAHIYVDFGVSYTFTFFGTHTITVDAGADLQIWGPEFSGKAQIHLQIISFEVSFGNTSSQQFQPIDWKTFKASFLPANEQICSISVKDGLVTKASQDKSDLGVINPKHFSLITNSVIPSKQAYRETEAQPLNIGEANTAFGIGSMDVKSNELTSTHTITIKKNGQPLQKNEFEYIPIYKNAPTGLWGQSLKPDLNQDGFINKTLSGFEIRPKNQPEGGHNQTIDRSKLQYKTEPLNDAYRWLNFQPFTAETLDDNARRKKIKTSIEQNSTRNDLLAALGFDKQEIDKIKLNPSLAKKFLLAPQVEALAG